MSKKKIGAYITLDGEKEFRSAVSSCNKNLATMKSEMKLVEAQTAGQANTLDTLRKKHDVLSRTLEEQVKKEASVKTGLEHAGKEYERVGKELQEYKDKLQTARSSLEELESSSESSEEALNQQKKTVEELKKIVSKGEETYRRAGERVSDWKKQLNNAEAQTIRATKALNENDAYLGEAEKSYNHCARSIDAFGEKTKNLVEELTDAGNVMRVKFAESVYETGESLLRDGIRGALGLQDANQKLAASTGATAEEMQAYSEVLKDLYGENYGDSVEELAENMALVRQYTGELDPDKLKTFTENAIALDDTFVNMDIAETLRGVDALMKSMGLSAEEAFDYITAGAQNGLNKSGELADNLAEYAPLWQQAGFSAQEMFMILDNGLNAGAYNLDRVNDFVKEFGNSMADGRIEKNLASFSEGTQELFYQWENGQASTKDVFYSVINDLQLMTNKQNALILASNVWSSLGEDNAMEVITSLNRVNDTFSDVKGSMERLKEVRYDSLINQYEQLGRTIQTELTYPALEKFLPMAEKAIKSLTEHTEVAIVSVGALGSAFAVNKVRKYSEEIRETGKWLKEAGVKASEFLGIKTAKTAATTAETIAEAVNTTETVANTTATAAQAAATATATVAQEGLNLAMYANPAALVIGGIVALTAVMVGLSSETQIVSDETDELCIKTKELSQMVKDSTSELEESYAGLGDSLESIGAKEIAANNLISELYALEAATDKTGDEAARMSVIVEELNSMFPELSLSVDKNTGALNKNQEQTRQSIDTYLKYLKVQSAQEKMAEIAKELTDAEMARYEAEENLKKIEEELLTLEAEREDLLKESSGLIESAANTSGQYAAKLAGEGTELEKNVEQTRKLKDAQEEQLNALEAMNVVCDTANEKYAEAYAYTESLTTASKENAEAVVSGAEAKNEASRASIEQVGLELEAYNNLSAAQQNLAVNVTNSVLAMQESVQSSLQSQMSIFEEFDAGVSISTENLLSNMQSQIDSVTAWEENLSTLMESTKTTADGAVIAIDEGLMQYLASLGPEGAGYVQAFVNMSGDELARANSLWQEKLAIENFTNEAGVRLTNSVGTLAAGGTEAFAQLGSELNMKANKAGVFGVQGLVDGMEAAQAQAEMTGNDLGVSVIDSLNKGLGCNSPSAKAKESGENTDAGLIKGMEEDMDLVERTGSKLGETAIEGLESCDLYAEGRQAGVNFGEGLSYGILLMTQLVANQAAAMVRTAIDAANKEQDAHSPAKETIKVGHNFGGGAEVGIIEEIPNVERASEKMIDCMLSTVSKKSKSIKELVSSAVDIRDINGTVGTSGNSFRTEEFLAMQSWLEQRLRTIKLIGYFDGREVMRTLSDRGVVFRA